MASSKARTTRGNTRLTATGNAGMGKTSSAAETIPSVPSPETRGYQGRPDKTVIWLVLALVAIALLVEAWWYRYLVQLL